jgi:hypothetical protein
MKSMKLKDESSYPPLPQTAKQVLLGLLAKEDWLAIIKSTFAFYRILWTRINLTYIPNNLIYFAGK